MIFDLWFCAESLLISFIAWQDWRERQVTLSVALLVLTGLCLKLVYPLHVMGILGTLMTYRYLRKNSIQVIDILLFSFGAGCFSLEFLPIYCMATAIILLIISQVFSIQRLPFITAWAFSFLGMYFTKKYISC